MARPPKLVDPGESPLHAFARLVIDARRAVGWPRARLAKAVNFGVTYVGEVERAEKLPPLDVALAMADALEVEQEVFRQAWSAAHAHLQRGREEPLVTDLPEAPAAEGQAAAPVPHGEAPGRPRLVTAGALAVAGLVALVLAVALQARDPSPRVEGPGPEITSGPTGTSTTTTRPSTTTTVTPLASRVSRDDFSQRNDWFLADDEKVLATVADGQYRVVLRERGSEYFFREPWATSAPSQKAEVDVQRVTPARSTFGVSCRLGPSRSGRPAHYAAAIAATGYWNILRYEGQENRSPTVVVEATERSQYSDAIRADGVNRVALECVGGGAAGLPVTLRLSVNGVGLAEATDPEGLAPGSVGLVVSSFADPVEVRFDNFSRTVL